MNTPKTAALWELLREMGWSEDQRPVSFIMQSHEELEKELSDLEAGFDADGRTAAEACCEEFKQEQARRVRELEKELAEARKQLADWQILQAATEHELAAANGRFEALAFDAARVEWKYGRNDDGTPKNWTEWNNLRESLGEHVRQPQELEPNEARH